MLTATPRIQNGDPYGIRTRVTTVKGWCLNHLTKGPKEIDLIFSMAEKEGFEPSRRFTRPTPLAGAPLQPTWVLLHRLAPQAGFEPATDRLTADCSTTELLRNDLFYSIILDHWHSVQLFGMPSHSSAPLTHDADARVLYH